MKEQKDIENKGGFLASVRMLVTTVRNKAAVVMFLIVLFLSGVVLGKTISESPAPKQNTFPLPGEAETPSKNYENQPSPSVETSAETEAPISVSHKMKEEYLESFLKQYYEYDQGNMYRTLNKVQNYLSDAAIEAYLAGTGKTAMEIRQYNAPVTDEEGFYAAQYENIPADFEFYHSQNGQILCIFKLKQYRLESSASSSQMIRCNVDLMEDKLRITEIIEKGEIRLPRR